MKPEKVIRFGAISVSIFLNEIEEQGSTRVFHNAKLQRRYRDGEEWKSATSLTLSDLPSAIAALSMAQDYIAAQEAVVTPSE